MKENLELNDTKLKILKFKILQVETENIVKKESNPAMEEKIKNIISKEVDKNDN